ncbi:13954_t:CDS:2, partial [Racocetra fulgida]
MTTNVNEFEEPFLADEQIQCDSIISSQTSSKLPSPLDSLKISSTEVLEKITERTPYGKSTVAHAKIIAPDDVEIISYSQMSKIENPGRTLLLFPGPNSKTLQEIPRSSFDKLLVVDGTWRQASNMARTNPELKNIRKVTINPQKTLFWRYQNKDEYHLATIEALYYFLKEYNEVYEIPEETIHSDVSGYDGRYDNLLWYFKYFYEFIQTTYRKQKGKKNFTTRQRE